MFLLLSTLILAQLVPAPAIVLADPPLTTEQVCARKWGLDARHVNADMKLATMLKAGLVWEDRSGYEIDHIVSRELGGADIVENLQAQCCIVKGHIVDQAHEKDVLENRLHRLVCAGDMLLEEAQSGIYWDWRKMLRENPKVR